MQLTPVFPGEPIHSVSAGLDPLFTPDNATSNSMPDMQDTWYGEGASQTQNALTALEQRFASLTRSIWREIVAMQRRLASAMRSLVADSRGDAKWSPKRDVSAAAVPRTRETLPVARNPYDDLINRAAKRYEIDPSLVLALVKQESGFHARAVSDAGAMGLMQLMPDTARSLGVADAFDPCQNIEAGTKLLRSLIDRYGGHLDLALAAYNAGPGAVDKYGGVPPYAQTQAYVRDILADYRRRALAS